MNNGFEEVSEVILTTPKCFRSISSNPAILACREISPYYIDLRVIYSLPEKRNIIIYWMVDSIDRYVEKGIDKLTTTETAGIPICSFVGDDLNIGTSYVKKKTKAYGLGKQIEGIIEKGEYVVGVDDLVTKGTTAEKAIKAVKEIGAEIDKYFVIFDRKQGGKELLKRYNVELYSLAEMCSQFIDIALKKGLITKNEYELFKKYSENPTEWSRNFIRENPNYLKEKIKEVVKDGKITSMAPLEVLTTGHPELKKEFEHEVRNWLDEFGVKHEVLEFKYVPNY